MSNSRKLTLTPNTPQLTLQTLRIMQRLWGYSDVGVEVIPYGCVSTGHEVGMIEVVQNAATYGGILESVMNVFNNDVLKQWIEEKSGNKKAMETAQRHFVKSCAGYCVFTYVLGIGDRHCDNLMVTKAGKLFHIDFGHFLGNFKSKMGIKRERTPFVFTQVGLAEREGDLDLPPYYVERGREDSDISPLPPAPSSPPQHAALLRGYGWNSRVQVQRVPEAVLASIQLASRQLYLDHDAVCPYAELWNSRATVEKR